MKNRNRVKEEPRSTLAEAEIVLANLNSTIRNAEDLILKLADEYRPAGLPPGALHVAWGRDRWGAETTLQKAIEYCRQNKRREAA